MTTASASVTDRIEKTILLNAPRSRVWKAIGDAAEFGTWFGIAFEGPFIAGRPLRGRITFPPEYANVSFDILVERVEPGRLLSFRWHPGGVDPAIDYSKEPSTLVTFTLEDAPEGTRLTVVESGFDALPEARRADAFRLNEKGWGQQMVNVERHVAKG
jgi:uncharacterized protein YndB with AHSA1/START domain